MRPDDILDFVAGVLADLEGACFASGPFGEYF